MEIDIRNKKKDADYVGRETIDLINKEAENSEIEAQHLVKTDRYVNALTEGKSQDNLHPQQNHKRIKSGLANSKQSKE